MKRMMQIFSVAMILFAGHASVAANVPQSPLMNSRDQIDDDWVVMAAESDMLEIQLGQLALKNADSGAITQMAEMLILHHTEHLQTMQTLAGLQGLVISPLVNAQSQKVVDYFTADNANWDRQFLNFNIKAHQANIDATNAVIASNKDVEVVAAATQTLPVLISHRDMVQTALDQSIANGAPASPADDCGACDGSGTRGMMIPTVQFQ
ncbi:MAG: DUF4142 domain-containing protein [Bdellovibrionota bacterium]